MSASPSPSPRFVRTVLLGACAVGLVGLGLTGGGGAVSSLSVSPAASMTLLAEPAAPHSPDFAAQAAARAAQVRAAQARMAAQRASRSRAQAIQKVQAKRAAARKAALAPKWFRPSYAGVGSYYGPRWGRMHKGVDFNGSTGDPIRAVGAGVVVGSGYLGSESGYGIITLIQHSNGYVTAYAHQSKSYVSSGERVEAGETIGAIGSTGHSTGSHLHFEVRTDTHGGQVNPLTWLRERGVRV